MSAPDIRWDDRGLCPAIAQDARTGRVLMLAWMNAEALEATRRTGYAHYWSRSRQALWKKGEESGHLQRVGDVRLDCDRDAVLVQVLQTGPACHTREPSCFFGGADGEVLPPPPATAVERLAVTIAERRAAPADRSYTRSLLDAGVPKIVAKVTEEAGELCQALGSESDDRVVSEAADLLYHALVGLEARGIPADAVAAELWRRFGTSGLAEKAARST